MRRIFVLAVIGVLAGGAGLGGDRLGGSLR